jgi:hypothetical protein
MRSAIRTTRATLRSNEELELVEYKALESEGYVREFAERMSRNCGRCGGFMVRDCERFSACRCVQCGDVIDPVVLKNRSMPSPPQKAKTQHDPMPVYELRMTA